MKWTVSLKKDAHASDRMQTITATWGKGTPEEFSILRNVNVDHGIPAFIDEAKRELLRSLLQKKMPAEREKRKVEEIASWVEIAFNL